MTTIRNLGTPSPRRTTLAIAAAACLGALFGTPLAHAAGKGELLIWINGDKGYEGLAKIGEKFTKDTGVVVKVEHPEEAIAKFEQAAAAGKGPDIWIWPHDRSGSWASAGLITPVSPSKKTVEGVDELAWTAWTARRPASTSALDSSGRDCAMRSRRSVPASRSRSASSPG